MGIFRYLLSDKYSYVDRIYDRLETKAINRWVLMLPGAGCSWAKKKGGGCHMCGFKTATKRYTLGFRYPSFFFSGLFAEGYEMIKDNKPELLAVFNGGSFLNDQEIPQAFQIEICNQVRNISSIRKLLVESRPEYITEKKIKSLTAALGVKKLIVGIGLECASDEIRSKSINKGFTKYEYEEAIKTLKNNGALILTYIFIKPIYLSERKAIEEAVESAQYAFSQGSDYVVFNSALVQKGTKMANLYLEGSFTPPWLWSVLEVARRTHNLGPIRVGDFSDEPTPIAGPKNCERCTPQMLDLFKRYKETGNITIFDGFDCECRRKWEEELKIN